jgi:hypothetical protein
MRCGGMAIALVLGGCFATPPEIDVSLEEPEARAAGEPVIPQALETKERGPESAPGCIENLLHDAAARLGMGHEHLEELFPLAKETVQDLDGDGVRDIVVVAESQCGVTGNCPRSLYLSGDGCWTHAVTRWWAYLEVPGPVHLGVRDIEVYVKGGCAGLEGTIVRLDWSGEIYEEVERIECRCEDQAPVAPVHPACPGAVNP